MGNVGASALMSVDDDDDEQNIKGIECSKCFVGTQQLAWELYQDTLNNQEWIAV